MDDFLTSYISIMLQTMNKARAAGGPRTSRSNLFLKQANESGGGGAADSKKAPAAVAKPAAAARAKKESPYLVEPLMLERHLLRRASELIYVFVLTVVRRVTHAHFKKNQRIGTYIAFVASLTVIRGAIDAIRGSRRFEDSLRSADGRDAR